MKEKIVITKKPIKLCGIIRFVIRRISNVSIVIFTMGSIAFFRYCKIPIRINWLVITIDTTKCKALVNAKNCSAVMAEKPILKLMYVNGKAIRYTAFVQIVYFFRFPTACIAIQKGDVSVYMRLYISVHVTNWLLDSGTLPNHSSKI